MIDYEYEDMIVGTPQEGNILQLLANIMLIELEARGLNLPDTPSHYHYGWKQGGGRASNEEHDEIFQKKAQTESEGRKDQDG